MRPLRFSSKSKLTIRKLQYNNIVTVQGISKLNSSLSLDFRWTVKCLNGPFDNELFLTELFDDEFNILVPPLARRRKEGTHIQAGIDATGHPILLAVESLLWTLAGNGEACQIQWLHEI